MDRNTIQKEFAIVTKSTEIETQTSLDDDFRNNCNTDKSDKIIISAGNLVKIVQHNNKNAKIQVMDYYNKNIIWENIYKCSISNLKKIQDSLFPFLIAIQDPEDRLQLILKQEHCKNIMCMKIDDIVTASGEPFRKDIFYDCIIRYIGLVPEIGPGYYFGLEILNLDNGYSPQAQFITFTSRYMQCEPELSLILSANWIHKCSNDAKKKFSTRELFCGTLERVQSALGLESGNSGGSSSSNSNSYKHIEKRKSFSKLKTIQNKENKTQISNNNNNNSNTDSLNQTNGSDSNISNKDELLPSVMDKKDRLNYHHHKSSLNTVSTSTSSLISNINLKKDKATNTTFAQRQQENSVNENSNINSGSNINNKSSSIDNDKDKKVIEDDLISLENEEYTRYVENYERGLEQRLYDTIDNKQIIPTSILKQSKNKRKPISNPSVKPNTIMSLEDRDIVVIDRADIKESVMNESEVIVVDKPGKMQKEVDLVEILGSNWPTSAGDAAVVLNTLDSNNKYSSVSGNNSGGGGGGGGSGHVSSSSNSSASSYNIRCERNKSINPISHLVSSKSIERRNKESLRNSLEQSSLDGSKTIEKKIKNSEPIYDSPNLNTSSQIISIVPSDDEVIVPSLLNEIPGTKLGIGSMVEVSTDVCEDLYGVIRWIGCPQGSKSIMIGVELEDDQDDRPLTLTDGTLNGKRLFKCQNGRALFVYPNQCSKDRRFLDIELPQNASSKTVKTSDTKMFGQVDCPPVPGAVAPLKIFNLEDLEAICGKFKGIQGHHNSCYLDATLFSMFTFTSVFDSLLFRPPEPEDIPHYEEVQKVLREEIVNPLRKNVFVRADRVMKLRQLLERLSSISGLTSEEKDPEEFLNSLLAQIMRAEPFLKLSSGQDAFFYQLFVEKDERLSFPSVQQLFEQSFLASDIKLKEVPSCLIIQMPRFGKNFKMYPRILPSQVLDVTDIIEDSPRQCSVCGKLAEFECRECFGILQCGVGLESTAFCKKCLETVHSHAKRANHTPKEISVPQDFKIMAEHLTVPRLFMELFAVVCIETSHYVAFVKAGSGLDAPWCFFDSMADRKGEQNGYNIPEMVSVPDLPQWLSEEGARIINEAASNDKMLPEHAKRLLCDAYMCMYQSTDVMMYR